MAKEIVSYIWCEIHLQKDEDRKPATEHQITVDGKVRTLDLCDDCHAEHLAPLLAILEQYGAEPLVSAGSGKKSSGKKSSTNKWQPDPDGKFRCKALTPDGVCGREFDTAQGMGRHNLSHE